MFSAFAKRALAPVDGASLRVFRVLFGLLVAFSAFRFVAQGWVQRFYGQPTFFFTYWGFDWVRPLPVTGMLLAYLLLGGLGLLVASGRLYRPAVVAMSALFVWLEFIDVTNYLNHYYLVSILSVLLCFLPATADKIPRGVVWLLRLQFAIVYTYAAWAKCSTDWLVHGQPLNIWLSSRTETPIIGVLFGPWWVALVMSWAGFLHDLLAPWLLSWRRTRPLMYATLVVFHVATGMLFQIGIFPILMIIGTTLYFAPTWPHRVWGLRRLAAWGNDGRHAQGTRWAIGVAAVFMTFQLVWPARSVLYGGDVNWHEQGMRWSWKVMCRAKSGAITYYVVLPATGRRFVEVPARYLTDQQEREFSGQPDMILQLAHHIGAQYAADGAQVQVYVDAKVSLNGRPPARLIDPDVDLMTRRRSLRPADWILPAPDSDPIRLRPRPQ